MKRRRITIAELILNRYVKKYDEKQIQEIRYLGGFCPNDFGYYTHCTTLCSECYMKNITNEKEIDMKQNEQYKNICEGLLQLFEKTNEVFVPTEEMARMIREIYKR